MLRNDKVYARDLDKRLSELDKLSYAIIAIVHIGAHPLTNEFEFKIYYKDNYDPKDDDIPF